MEEHIDALTDQMQRAAGLATYWLDWVAVGNRPHMHGKDNTAAFVAHCQRQLSLAADYLKRRRN